MMLLQGVLWAGLILSAVSFHLEPDIQRVLSTPNRLVQKFHAASDTAGSPNKATRLEVTSDPDASLFCARDGDKSTAGYAHFTNSDGIEDKHMFWWLFQSRKDPSNAPLVMVHGGGPGSSGMFMPFSGAGPCRLTAGDDGNGNAVAADYSWIDEVNLLAIDHPVGVGFSYGEATSMRNSSERAAWDVDDFLQAFWTEYPDLAKNQFMIHSASYGGTYIPNIVNVIYSRNVAAKADRFTTRILKMPDAVMIGNGWSDPIGNYRWWMQANCHDNPIINSTGCDAAISVIPACLEALQFSYEQPSIEHRASATSQCDEALGKIYQVGSTGRNPYHATQSCAISEVYDCFPEMSWLNTVMSLNEIRHLVGVPDSVEFAYSSEDVYRRFVANGDMAQPAYLLLAPVINSGLRVMVYNGNTDGVCSWRSNLSWMNLLKTDHQAAFRSAPEVSWPGIGSIRKVGEGAGSFTFLSIDDAGHFVEWDRQDAFREILVKWLRNENLGLDMDTDTSPILS